MSPRSLLDGANLLADPEGRAAYQSMLDSYIAGAGIDNPVAEHVKDEGPHPVELFVIEHAWMERAIRFDYSFANNADGGEVDESEFELEAFWYFDSNDKLGFFIEAPLTLLDPIDMPNTAGFGDLEVGFRANLFQNADMTTLVAGGLGVQIPTGDEDRGLGSGHVALEPGLFLFHEVAERFFFQGQLLYEIAVDGNADDEELKYGLALSYTIERTEDCEFLKNLTPIIEVNGFSPVSGEEAGQTVVNLTLGFRWIVTEDYLAGFGYNIPVTGRENFDSQLVFSLVRHFGAN